MKVLGALQSLREGEAATNLGWPLALWTGFPTPWHHPSFPADTNAQYFSHYIPMNVG